MNLDSADDIRGEGVDKERFRFFFGQTARLKIEHLICVQLSYRRAVRAFHIVGEDFQLRLCVYLRRIREKQRFVGLFGVSFLRVEADKNLAVEHSPRPVIQHILIQFVAGAVRHGMVNRGVIVHQASPIAERQTVQGAFNVFATEIRADVVASEVAAEGQVMRREDALVRHSYLRVGDMKSGFALAVQFVVIEMSVLRDEKSP